MALCKYDNTTLKNPKLASWAVTETYRRTDSLPDGDDPEILLRTLHAVVREIPLDGRASLATRRMHRREQRHRWTVNGIIILVVVCSVLLFLRTIEPIFGREASLPHMEGARRAQAQLVQALEEAGYNARGVKNPQNQDIVCHVIFSEGRLPNRAPEACEEGVHLLTLYIYDPALETAKEQADAIQAEIEENGPARCRRGATWFRDGDVMFRTDCRDPAVREKLTECFGSPFCEPEEG